MGSRSLDNDTLNALRREYADLRADAEWLCSPADFDARVKACNPQNPSQWVSAARTVVGLINAELDRLGAEMEGEEQNPDFNPEKYIENWIDARLYNNR